MESFDQTLSAIVDVAVSLSFPWLFHPVAYYNTQCIPMRIAATKHPGCLPFQKFSAPFRWNTKFSRSCKCIANCRREVLNAGGEVVDAEVAEDQD